MDTEAAAGLVKALLDAMRSADSAVNSAAAYALGNLAGTLDASQTLAVVGELRLALKAEAPAVRASAAAALGNFLTRIDPASAQVLLGDLRNTLRSQDLAVQRSGIYALAPAGQLMAPQQARAVVADLLAVHRGGDRELASATVYALDKIAATLEPETAALTFGDLTSALEAAPRTDGVRSDLAEPLAVLASRIRQPAVAGTALILLETDHEVMGPNSGFAADLRHNLTVGWPQRSDELVGWLSSGDPRYRSFAVHVLANRQPLPPELVEQLRALQNDPEARPWTRVAATRCLVELSRQRLETGRRRRATETANGTIEADVRPQQLVDPVTADPPPRSRDRSV
ncbi:MAG: hypothetical protein FIA97_11740 [Methylococcaceae bacterium]|nr:hypothetical protein [Methylococcaceae bacterium]